MRLKNRAIKVKRNKRLFFFLLSGFLLAFQAFSQTSPTDTVLSPLQFFEAVNKFHPLVRQAGLQITMAEKELLQSRGQFDPKLQADFNRKSFDGKDYYNLFNPELKIPTWTGLEVKAGFERNVGAFVSGENQTPSTGLQYLGLSLPLVQGLMTDARRTSLKQAKIGIDLARAEQQKMVNKILFSAAKDYWEWYFAHRQLRNAELALRLATERYNAVKLRILVGDQASIDSVEAQIFRQDREIFLNEARVVENNARLRISAYLWSEEDQPLEILPGIAAQLPPLFQMDWSDSSRARIRRQAMEQHPEILKLRLKGTQLDLDRRLAGEMLKPMVQLRYSWLSRTDQAVWSTQTIDRNYKFGFDVSYPLLLRKERGKLGMVKTKIFQNNLEIQQTQRDVGVDIQTSFNEMQTLEGQIRMQKMMVENYDKLRLAEIRKFDNGESSLFLINSREAKLIEGLIKLASLESKFQKSRSTLLYSAGKNPLLPLP
jgi:outer membrane protein